MFSLLKNSRLTDPETKRMIGFLLSIRNIFQPNPQSNIVMVGRRAKRVNLIQVKYVSWELV